MAHRWIATPGCVKLHAGGTMLEKVSNDNEFSMALSEGLDKDRTHTITVTYTGDCSYFGIGVANSYVPLGQSPRRLPRGHAWFFLNKGFLCDGREFEDDSLDPVPPGEPITCAMDMPNNRFTVWYCGEERGTIDGVDGDDLRFCCYLDGTRSVCTILPTHAGKSPGHLSSSTAASTAGNSPGAAVSLSSPVAPSPPRGHVAPCSGDDVHVHSPSPNRHMEQQGQEGKSKTSPRVGTGSEHGSEKGRRVQGDSGKGREAVGRTLNLSPAVAHNLVDSVDRDKSREGNVGEGRAEGVLRHGDVLSPEQKRRAELLSRLKAERERDKERAREREMERERDKERERGRERERERRRDGEREGEREVRRRHEGTSDDAHVAYRDSKSDNTMSPRKRDTDDKSGNVVSPRKRDAGERSRALLDRLRWEAAGGGNGEQVVVGRGDNEGGGVQSSGGRRGYEGGDVNSSSRRRSYEEQGGTMQSDGRGMYSLVGGEREMRASTPPDMPPLDGRRRHAGRGGGGTPIGRQTSTNRSDGGGETRRRGVTVDGGTQTEDYGSDLDASLRAGARGVASTISRGVSASMDAATAPPLPSTLSLSADIGYAVSLSTSPSRHRGYGVIVAPSTEAGQFVERGQIAHAVKGWTPNQVPSFVERHSVQHVNGRLDVTAPRDGNGRFDGVSPLKNGNGRLDGVSPLKNGNGRLDGVSPLKEGAPPVQVHRGGSGGLFLSGTGGAGSQVAAGLSGGSAATKRKEGVVAGGGSREEVIGKRLGAEGRRSVSARAMELPDVPLDYQAEMRVTHMVIDDIIALLPGGLLDGYDLASVESQHPDSLSQVSLHVMHRLIEAVTCALRQARTDASAGSSVCNGRGGCMLAPKMAASERERKSLQAQVLRLGSKVKKLESSLNLATRRDLGPSFGLEPGIPSPTGRGDADPGWDAVGLSRRGDAGPGWDAVGLSRRGDSDENDSLYGLVEGITPTGLPTDDMHTWLRSSQGTPSGTPRGRQIPWDANGTPRGNEAPWYRNETGGLGTPRGSKRDATGGFSTPRGSERDATGGFGTPRDSERDATGGSYRRGGLATEMSHRGNNVFHSPRMALESPSISYMTVTSDASSIGHHNANARRIQPRMAVLEFDTHAVSAAAERDSDDDDSDGLATSQSASPTAAPPPPPPRLSPEALKDLSERESEYWGATVSTPRNMRSEGEYWGEATGAGAVTTIGGGSSSTGSLMQRGVSAAASDYWRDVASLANGAGRGVCDAGARERGGEAGIIRSNERWGMMLGRETLDSDISEIVSHGVVPEQGHRTPERGGDERAVC